MKKTKVMKLLIVLFTITISTEISKAKIKDKYDIVIYGANSAGVIAAYTAKTMGKSVVLISPDGHVGGLSTGGLGATDIGNKMAIGGISREFYKKLGKAYGKDESWIFEPKEAAKIFNDYLESADIPVIYNQRAKKINKNKARISSIDLTNTYGSDETTQQIE